MMIVAKHCTMSTKTATAVSTDVYMIEIRVDTLLEKDPLEAATL